MSYSVTVTIDDLFVPKNKIKKLKEYIDKEYIPASYRDLTEFFSEIGLDSYFTEDGDLMIDSYERDTLCDVEEDVISLAPYFANDGSIEILGEDGERWRYLFNKGKAIKQKAEYKWVDDTEEGEE
jgi:hypothetical protein